MTIKTYGDEGEFKYLTYNVGLSRGVVPYIKERRPFIIDRLLEKDPDVICLQEVWRQKDLNIFIDELSQRYPHSYHPPIAQKYEKNIPTCGVTEIYGEGKILSCLWNKCRKQKYRGFNQCLIENCMDEYDVLLKKNRECSNALIVQFQEKSFWGLFHLLNPFRGSAVFMEGGSTGLVLFSKKRLHNKKFYNFSEISTFKKRGAIYSEIKLGKDKKRQNIICAHLTPNLNYKMPYAGLYESWEEENEKQMDKLLGRVGSLKEPFILMGDLNCSFPIPEKNIASENLKSCQKVLKKGFSNFLLQKRPVCTFCEGNNLLIENRHDGLMVDHIFVKNKQILDSKILFNEIVEFDEAKENTVKTHLSGHYGVQITHSIE